MGRAFRPRTRFQGSAGESRLARRIARPICFGRKRGSMYRRDVLRLMGNGFGVLALADSLRAAGQGPLGVKPPHFAARAQRVIFLFMNGGWSQVDTFDPKPALDKH